MKRSNLLLLGLFLILGIAVVILEKPFSKPVVKTPPELGIMFPDFKSDAIAKMEFGSFGGSTILTKENEKWFVTDEGKNYPADSDAVTKALETVGTLKAKELISTNPAKHVTFQVNASQDTETTDESGNKQPFKMGTLGTEVKMFDKDNNLQAHFFVGKNGAADFMSTYVRKDGTDSVVMVEGYLKAVFGKGAAANWKDRLLSKIDESTYQQIILGEGKDQVVLEAYSDGPAPEQQPASPEGTPAATPPPAAVKWRMTTPLKVELEKKHSDRYVRMFGNFQATDYAPEATDPTEFGFEKPLATAKIVLKDGTEMKFIAGAESKAKPGQFYFKKEGDDRVFLVPKYRIDALQKSAKEITEDDKPKTPEMKPPSKAPDAKSAPKPPQGSTGSSPK
jgi:hypothetical protein